MIDYEIPSDYHHYWLVQIR